MWTLKWRAIKGIGSYWLEIGAALFLLQSYGIKWFLFFWFLQTIFARNAFYEMNRCRTRFYQTANECKVMAIMKHLGVTREDAQNIFEEAKAEMTKEALNYLEDDLRIGNLC
jgi:hypothetical protein